MAPPDEPALSVEVEVGNCIRGFNNATRARPRRKFLSTGIDRSGCSTRSAARLSVKQPARRSRLILLSATHTIVSAPPVTRTAERIYQIFGKETLAQTLRATIRARRHPT